MVISEMLRKQDQQAEILKETNETLKNFVDISVQQFQQQQKFNEHFLGRLDQVKEQFSINFERQNAFNERTIAQADKQNEFNERFLSKLDEIVKKP